MNRQEDGVVGEVVRDQESAGEKDHEGQGHKKVGLVKESENVNEIIGSVLESAVQTVVIEVDEIEGGGDDDLAQSLAQGLETGVEVIEKLVEISILMISRAR